MEEIGIVNQNNEYNNTIDSNIELQRVTEIEHSFLSEQEVV